MYMLFFQSQSSSLEIVIQYFDLDDGELNQIKYIKVLFLPSK